MFIDLTGEVFGKWKVLKRVENDISGVLMFWKLLFKDVHCVI